MSFKREETISIETVVNAPTTLVWAALTEPGLMNEWMLDEKIDILTDWTVGSPIVIKGTMHWVYFENKGTVLEFEQEKKLSYDHLSSLSKLPDEPKNYSLIKFELEKLEYKTLLKITLSNFPTESIYQHLNFYWKTTILILKKIIEQKKP